MTINVQRLAMRLIPALSIFVLTFTSGCSQEDTAARACSPPLKSWGEPHPHLGPDVPEFTVSLDHNGSVYLDGKLLDMNTLSSRLAVIGAIDNPEPPVILETEMGAPCQRLEEVRSLMSKQLRCDQEGHCDEGLQTVWRDLPYEGKGIP